MNDRFLRALRRQPVDRTPLWVMRQAGRYLPEYRKVRQQAGDFMTLCRTPELACEVTMQPIDRFDLDAAILFSDILTIPDAMGLGLHFVEGEGPKFKRPLQTAADIKATVVPEVDDLQYVMDAVTLIKKTLNNRVPLIGFSGSPWTLACYMIEGGSSKNFHRIKQMMYQHPEALTHLLSVLSQAVTDYLLAQIEAGVDVVQIFDSWGGILSSSCYQAFSLHFMQDIVTNIKAHYPEIPVIVFTKGGGLWLEAIADSGCDAVGLDWTIDIGEAKDRIGEEVALQGNLDPAILLGGQAAIEAGVHEIMQTMHGHSGHVFNLGHGITPDVPPQAMADLVAAVRSYKGEAA